jgi:hypothetical protein
MKLRFSSDQIRIRVRKSDIEALERDGQLTETIALPGGGNFGFSIRLDGQTQQIYVRQEGSLLAVFLPENQARHWINSEEVGMEAALPTANQGLLQVAVEKDFPCQHQPTKNPEDTFGELVKDR